MKTAYEYFEEFEKDVKFEYMIEIEFGNGGYNRATFIDTILATVENDVLELALDVKGFPKVWLTADGMESIINYVNQKWNEICDLFFEYSKLEIKKDMVKKHLEGSDEKRCRRLIGNLKRRNEKRRHI